MQDSFPGRVLRTTRRIRLLPIVFVLVALLSSGCPIGAGAQVPVDLRLPAIETKVYDSVYRPSGAQYRILRGERFDFVYQVGSEEMVRRSQAALRSTWPATDSIVGSVASNFGTPIVINGYSDRGNGFVEPFPFRQEIQSASNRSDALVARSSSWPALVGPHELVHSAHLDADAGVGVGGLVRLFGPDQARAINGTAPRGLVEGVAVYRESRIEESAGRLNAPLFTMKMKAAMLSDDPWTLTEMLENPVYTQPFNRHYIGGGHAFQYLAERGGDSSTEFFRDAVRWHNRFPFLGHGVWLGVSTDQFPHEISSEIQANLRETYQAELERRAPFTPTSTVAGKTGVNHRRPYWLDHGTLVAYVHGYDVRPGFYRIDVSTGERTPIRIQSLTEDRVYSVSPDTSALYASRYVPNSLVRDQQIAEVERIDLATGRATLLTDGGRAFAPVEDSEGRVHVATNDGPFSQWSVVDESGQTHPLVPSSPTSVRQIAPPPGGGATAVLVNVGGDQQIYRAEEGARGGVDLEPWIGLDDSIIYDLSWGPEGRYLLFAADHPETANVFAFDTETQQLLLLANVRFGAMEPALSPDRSRLAFVNYRHERHDLVTLPFRPDSATVVPASAVQLGGTVHRSASVTSETDSLSFDRSRPYSPWRHLVPRMVYPSVHSTDDFDTLEPDDLADTGVGVTLSGADPLKQWAYRASTYWQDGTIWGEAQVETGEYLLRPSLNLFDRPLRLDGSNPGIEERGIGIGLQLPLTLRSNVYQSLLQFGFDTELRQIRFYGGGLSEPTAFSRRLTLNPSVLYGYRLQQNGRDLVPNTGVVIGVAGEFDTWVDPGRTGLSARKGVVSGLSVYLPFLRDSHTGIRLGAGLLTQNLPTFGTSNFVPRGYDTLGSLDNVDRASGTFLQFDLEVTQPVWYVDEGFSLIPLYLKALSLYGFGETFGRMGADGWREKASSVGAGVSLRTRFFYLFNFDLRIGGAFRIGPGDFEAIYR